MKQIKLYLAVFIGLLLMSGNTTGFLPPDIPDGIILALKKGSASDLAKYINVNVELTIDGNEQIYSKEQAELILKDFFIKNPVNSFSIIHKGGKEDSRYAIGNLNTVKGDYRLTLLVKIKDNMPYIHQLRIEKENAQ
ncbi:MAG: DUF4783 domain-containing protein [Bacteroidales bacterium]|nr:DUF4783 domain-containing protein [Bacteroidales bacterium]